MTRIIAGSARGRQLATPRHSATRPTTDRVREAAFSVLAGWSGGAGGSAAEQLRGLSFLDLYAGTGAVALEAASRGAEPVWAVEADRGTAAIIKANTAATGLPVQVRAQSVESAVRGKPPRPFDIVWADPPYELPADELDEVLNRLVRSGWLSEAGMLVVERSGRTRAPIWPKGLQAFASRNYGETCLYFGTSAPDQVVRGGKA
jgi:16S rRNA (guanine966-N2)-methyltransferase